MRTMPIEQPVASAQVLIENEVFSHQPHRLDRIVGELARAGDRMPVTAQQLAHGGAAPDPRQHLVLALVHSPNLPAAAAPSDDARSRERDRNYPKLVAA